MITPGILTIDPGETSTRMTQLASQAAFGHLVTLLRSALPTSALSEAVKRADVQNLLKECVMGWLGTGRGLNPGLVVRGSGIGGFNVSTPEPSCTACNFNLSNYAFRYAKVTRRPIDAAGNEIPDGITVGIGGSTHCAMAGGNPASWGSMFTLSAGAPTTAADSWRFSAENPTVQYWAVGMGLLPGEARPPSVGGDSVDVYGCTLFHYLFLPAAEALTGGLGLLEHPETIVGIVDALWDVSSRTLDLSYLQNHAEQGDLVAVTADLLDLLVDFMAHEGEFLNAVGVTTPAWSFLGDLFSVAGTVFGTANLAIAASYWAIAPHVLKIDIHSVTSTTTPTTVPPTSTTLGFMLEKVAAVGEPAAGRTIADITDSGSLLENGAVAFPATLAGDTKALLIGSSGAPIQDIVVAGDSSPIGGTFSDFSGALVDGSPEDGVSGDGSRWYFAAHVSDGTAGIFHRGSDGLLTSIVARGDATGTRVGGTFGSFFSVPSFDTAGDVAFTADIVDGTSSNAVFVQGPNGFTALIAEGDPSPLPDPIFGGFLNFSAFGNALLFDDASVVVAGQAGGLFSAQAGFFHITTSAVGTIVAEGSSVQGGRTVAGLCGLTAGGAPNPTWLTSSLSDGQKAILRAMDGSAVVVLVTGSDPAPAEIGGSFDTFKCFTSVDFGNGLAFGAQLTDGAASEGIFFRHKDGSIQLVAASGDAAPGGGTFTAFGGGAAQNVNGQIAFWAQVSDSARSPGIFIATPTQ